MGIEQYSPSPPNNNSAPPVGAPENATPLNAVNDILRTIMAFVRSWYNDPNWRNVGDGNGAVAAVYDAADKFRIPSIAAAAFFPVGKHVKIVAGSWTRKGKVTAVTTAGSDTIVQCSLDGVLSNVTFTVYVAGVDASDLPGVAEQPNGGAIPARTSSGGLRATSFHDGTSYNANLGSSDEGRGLVAGFSGGWYGGIGYNIRHAATSGTFIHPLADKASYLEFYNGGMRLFTAASGAAGRQTNWSAATPIFEVTSAGGAAVNGATVWHSGNLSDLGDLPNTPGFITTDGRAYPRLVGGGQFNMRWEDPGGLPSYFVGATDGNNFYVYPPSRMSVNYAGSAGDADKCDGYHASIGNNGNYIAVRSAEGYIYAQNFRVESDVRLKSKIEDIDGKHALEAILDIGGKRYIKHSRNDSRPPTRELGHIAQDVERWFPEAVGTDGDGFKTLEPLSGPTFAAIAYIVRRLRQQGIEL